MPSSDIGREIISAMENLVETLKDEYNIYLEEGTQQTLIGMVVNQITELGQLLIETISRRRDDELRKKLMEIVPTWVDDKTNKYSAR
jgi:hypothetical protein